MHWLLKRNANQTGEVEQSEVENVLTGPLKDIYLMKAKVSQGGKTRDMIGLFGQIIMKVINRLKT